MNISQIETNLSYLTDEFPDLSFQLFKSDNDNVDYIHCIVCHISHKVFVNQWTKIMNVTAVKLQEILSSELEIWNTYLIFCLDTEPDTEIKYHVENNTLFMRKLVTSQREWPTNNKIEDFIAKEIFCTDLKLKSANNTDDLEPMTNHVSCLSAEFLLLEKIQKDSLETELSNIVNNIATQDTTNEN